MKLFPNFVRYTNENSFKATKLYQEVATARGLTLTQLSLAFVHQQKFVTSTIIGATNLTQLKENISSIEIELSTSTLKQIDAIQELQPNPAP